MDEIFVSGISTNMSEITISDQRDKPESANETDAALTYLVKDVARTSCAWGIGTAEVKRLVNAAHFMASKRFKEGRLWFYSTDSQLDPETIHDTVDQFTRRLVNAQKQAGLPQYWIKVWEGTPSRHAHGIFLATGRMVEALQQSQLGAALDIRPVTYQAGLTLGYLVKERTPQAEYARKGQFKMARLKGSHRLEGGGDRVVLSAALKQDAIAAGYIQPWKRTNAQRSVKRKPYRTRALTARAVRPVGQVELFPELAQPAARLRDFHGGILSPSAALELDFHRTRLGLTQSHLGQIAGISQPQIANAVKGRFGLSLAAAARIRAALSEHGVHHAAT